MRLGTEPVELAVGMRLQRVSGILAGNPDQIILIIVRIDDKPFVVFVIEEAPGAGRAGKTRGSRFDGGKTVCL